MNVGSHQAQVESDRRHTPPPASIPSSTQTSLGAFLGGKAASLGNRLSDFFTEQRLSIRTAGRQPVSAPDAVPYSTFAYWSIQRVLDRLQLTPDDVFVDLGCGRGRVVCCAALRAARKIIGVDIDPDLCQQARQNAARLRGRRTPVEILNVPAQDCDYSECTVMFMFNPFGRQTVTSVAAAIIDSIQRKPRSVRFGYVNPRHDEVFRDSGAFEQFDRWTPPPWSRLKFDVSFWRSLPRE
ncbi:MAG: methyltransferase domain-containing protein [Phycisphaerales bacterium]|nr:methyltransferase domain-containing protein [Phycisphaerales bacterium]MCI0632168.1 methyltransferase domain-containing protein [Phycisphaerales bacterium]MCI0677139.1 methyltransferase domain-containing protein [Phycisphaerales bacterium]